MALFRAAEGTVGYKSGRRKAPEYLPRFPGLWLAKWIEYAIFSVLIRPQIAKHILPFTGEMKCFHAV